MVGAGPQVHEWQLGYRRRLGTEAPQAILSAHPQFQAIPAGFCVGAYLEKNGDVADIVASPGEAILHYLEYGIAEGRDGLPDRAEPGFLAARYGLTDPGAVPPVDIPARLRAAGIDEADIVLTEAQLWLLHGIHGPVMERLFQHEVYFGLATRAGMPPPSADRLDCMLHYATQGLAAGLPPHPDHRFDAGFFRAAADWRGLDVPPGDLQGFWARVGLRAGAHANPRAQVAMEDGLDLPEAIFGGLKDFAVAAPDLDDRAGTPETLAHLVNAPWPGAAVYDPATPGVAPFLLALAQKRRRRGDSPGAEALLRHVLHADPDNPHARIDLADLIHPQRRIDEEIALRAPVGAGHDNGANAVTLAERLLDKGALSDALDIAETLPATIFGDVTLRRRRLTIGRRAFNRIWSDLPTWIDRAGVAGVQALVARALTILTPPVASPGPRRAIRRVAILTSSDIYQCRLYRADQKADQLRHAGYAVTVFDQARDLQQLDDRLESFDAVIFVRLAAFPQTVDLMVRALSEGLATFYDADDLIFDASHFPPPLDSYAGTITPLDHNAIACGVPLFRHAMGLCDFGIASTPAIRDAMEGVVRSGRAFLHRNALGQPHMRAIAAAEPTEAGDKVVIFYGSGTKAHKRDLATLLEPAIERVLAARPGKVALHIMGEMSGLTRLSPDHPDITVIPPVWDFEAYCAELARADINLAVLERSPATDAKSEIKWLEAAMFAIPSVVSPTALYRDVIRPDETGLFAETPEAFATQILRLADDPGLRRRIGGAARDRALSAYGPDAMADNLRGIFDAAVPPVPPAARRTRLLIVNVFYPPQDIGGATRVVRDTVRDLVDRYGDAFEIDVITTTEGGRVPYTVSVHAEAGVRVWAVTAADGIETMQVQDPAMGDVFDRLLDRIGPDIVHFHCIQRLTGSVVDTVRRRALPYVITLHDGWWVSPHQFITDQTGTVATYDFKRSDHALPVRARLTRRWLTGADAVLAVSPAFADLHRAAGLPKVEVNENGGPAPAPRKAGPDGMLTLGLIGGASRHKGYMLLRAAIEAVTLSNIRLLVVDHAMSPGRVRHDIWNGTPVQFTGRVPMDRVDEIYARIDVLLAPSIWPESYGLVTREALQAGLWVVASDRGAIGAPVIEGRNGHIVGVEDPMPLAALLGRMDAAPARYKQAPAIAPNLRDVTAQTDELVRVYRRLRR